MSEKHTPKKQVKKHTHHTKHNTKKSIMQKKMPIPKEWAWGGITLVGILILILGVMLLMQPTISPQDDVVVYIDGKGITYQEIEVFYEGLLTINPMLSIDQALDQMIAITLLLNEAQALDITVDEGDALAQFDFQVALMGEDELMQILEEQQKDFETLKEEIVTMITQDMLITQVLETQVEVHFNDTQLQEAYEEYQQEAQRQLAVSMYHLVICHNDVVGCTSGLSQQEALQKATQLRSEVTIENFADVAKQQGMPDEGFVDFFQRGVYPQAFDDIVFYLETGEISDVFETEQGYHIVMIEQRKVAYPLEFEEFVEEYTRMEQRRAELLYIEQLKNNANIIFT
ncbi:MAG: peptidylprolyl isomerase [Candidatus Woesearchaeota archaeon]